MSKKISNKERLELYENFFQRLHFLRHLSGNERAIIEMLAISDAVVMGASTHDALGKPLTEDQIVSNINASFDLMRKLP
jgi:hypothetical protein